MRAHTHACNRMLFRQMDAVKTHSGWAWPGIDHLLHAIPSYGGAVFHDYHHRSFLFNYASRLQFLDVWFGTYKQPYDPLVEPAPAADSSSARVSSAAASKLQESPFVYRKKKAA